MKVGAVVDTPEVGGNVFGFSSRGENTTHVISELDSLVPGLGSQSLDGTEDGVRVPR